MSMVKAILPLIITAVVLCMAQSLHAEETTALPSASTPETTAKGVDDMADYRRLGWEWFGMKLGAPMLHHFLDDMRRRTFFAIDLLLPVYRWENAYLSVAELHVGYVFGDFGISAGGGYRLALGDNLDYEMRFGASFGYRTLEFGHGDALVPAPHVQVIANYNHGSFGLGFELPLYLHLHEYTTVGFFGSGDPGNMFQMEFFFHIRFSVF